MKIQLPRLQIETAVIITLPSKTQELNLLEGWQGISERSIGVFGFKWEASDSLVSDCWIYGTFYTLIVDFQNYVILSLIAKATFFSWDLPKPYNILDFAVLSAVY